MNTVTLTRISSGFANRPAAYRIGDHDKGDDAGTSVAQYTLPDGYELGETIGGEQAIFGPRGHCEVIEHPSQAPQLVDSSSTRPVLRRA